MSWSPEFHTGTPEYEERSLLHRTSDGHVAACFRKLSVEAALRMQGKGLVRCSWDEWRGRPVLLVSRAVAFRPLPPWPRGGAAA